VRSLCGDRVSGVLQLLLTLLLLSLLFGSLGQ
jgi:hypothetical protein